MLLHFPLVLNQDHRVQCRVEKPILSRIKFYFRQFWMNVKWAWALNMIRLKIRRSPLVCSARHAASNSRKTYCWDPILGSVLERSEECRYENVCFSDLTSHLIGGCSGSGFFSGFWVVASFAYSRGSRRSVLIFRVVVVLRASKKHSLQRTGKRKSRTYLIKLMESIRGDR